MQWIKRDNVAQYDEADWSHEVKRDHNLTLEQAQQIAEEDPTITFFFYCRESMILTKHGSFQAGDAVFFSGTPWYGSAPQCDAYENVKAVAANTFHALTNAFKQSNNFWQLGHAFDTIIDYFLLVDSTEASNFAQYALDQYQTSGDPQTGNACWYDDFGWWGIAALKASQHPELFGASTSQFRDIAGGCWNTMYANAPHVWDQKTDQSKYGYMKPRFQGGVWNFYPTDQKLNGPCSGNTPCAPKLASALDCDPKRPPLCVIQNTVTNTLYLVLAARMAAAYPTDISYQTTANTEYNFLYNWFYQVPESDHALLRTDLNQDRNSMALVRERVSTFGVPDEQGQYAEVCGYNKDRAWAGDQGLLIGGLVDLIQMPGRLADPSQLLTLAEQILAGVLFEANTNNKGLLPYWLDPNDTLDPGDYSTGIGVYMRYLLYAYQNNTDLKTYLQNTGYPAFVYKNAQNVPNPPLSSELVELTNDLATLVAAIAMLE